MLLKAYVTVLLFVIQNEFNYIDNNISIELSVIIFECDLNIIMNII